MREADVKLAEATSLSALGGALAGAIIGVIVTGKITGAVVGGVIGATSGAFVGYSFTKLKQISDENTRFASIRVTANQDLTRANRLQLYAYESLMCYMQEFENAHTLFEQGKIFKDEYLKRFVEIRNAMKELGKTIGNIEGEIARTEKEFSDSFSRTEAPVKKHEYAPQPLVKSTKSHEAAKSKKKFSMRKEQITAHLTRARTRTRESQQKNDADLEAMLDDCAGLAHPPRQNAQVIEKIYGDAYADLRQRIDEFRATHQEVMLLMEEAAQEAGLDMV